MNQSPEQEGPTVTDTQPDAQPDLQEMAMEAIHQESAQAVDDLRRRAAALNLEVRLRDAKVATLQKVIARLETQVGDLQGRLDDMLGETEKPSEGTDAGTLEA